MHKLQWKKALSGGMTVLLLFALSSCGNVTAPPRLMADASALSFAPSVYYGNYGKISFLYETGVDEVLPQQDTNEVVEAESDSDEAKVADENGSVATTVHQKDVVSISNSQKYAIVVSYESGTRDEEALPDALSGVGTDENNPVTVSDEVHDGMLAGYMCRVCTMQNTDGGGGKLYFGNTESGYFEVYCLLEQAAGEDEAQHYADIVSSICFGQYTENDLIFDDNSTVYVQMNAQ